VRCRRGGVMGKRLAGCGPGSPVAGPPRADGGPGRLPSGKAMPVKNHSAEAVAEDEHDGGTCRGGDAGEQRREDHVIWAGRGGFWLSGPVQPYLDRGCGRRVVAGGSGHRGEGAGPFGSAGQPPPGPRCGRGGRDGWAGLGQYRHGWPQARSRRVLGLIEIPGEARGRDGDGEESRYQGDNDRRLDTVGGPPQLVAAEKPPRQAPQRSQQHAALTGPGTAGAVPLAASSRPARWAPRLVHDSLALMADVPPLPGGLMVRIGFQWTARRGDWKGDSTCSGIARRYTPRRAPAARDASRRAVSPPIAGADIARVIIACTTGNLSDALTRGRRIGRLTGHGKDHSHGQDQGHPPGG
jgi:hypothetical protein